MSVSVRPIHTIFLVLTAFAAVAAPPVIEISDARPLFAFQAPARGDLESTAYAQGLVESWGYLPESLRNYSAYSFDWREPNADMGTILAGLREHGIAASVTIAGPSGAWTLETVAQAFAANPNLVAVHVEGVPVTTPTSYGAIAAAEPSPGVKWLTGLLELGATHGRFVCVEWDTRTWLRVLSEPEAEPLYHALRYFAPYVVLIHPMENPTVLTSTAAITGLWLEGAANHWGLNLSPEWYSTTDFVQPGVWGVREPGAHAPPAVYRALTLSGAMAGATVYRFEDAEDLWSGSRGYQWAESIAPTLAELIDLAAIPRRDLVAKSVQLAYQCGSEESPVNPEQVLGEVNPAFGAGAIERHAYGAVAARVSPDPFPNHARNYIVPLISPYGGVEVAQQFRGILLPGLQYTEEEWQGLFASSASSRGEGTATIVSVGRTVFVMHNRENAYERQAYRIPEMPAPVRGVKVRRTAEGVELSWPFRENDFAYTVYRRVLPELGFEPVARNLDVRTYLDSTAPAGETVAYALTALTNEPEAIEGAVNWGEYRVYSAAVSRIEEEVIVFPETEIAISAPVAVISRDMPQEQSLWPAINGLSAEDTATASEVASRLELLQRSVMVEDSEFAASLFAREYQGADGSNLAFAARVFESFFERYERCELFLQPQEWFVENLTEPKVYLRVYAHLSGLEAGENGSRVKSIARVAELQFGKRDGDWRIISAERPFPSLVDIAP